ncbi:MAG: serine protease [Planctomycetaceae bacterium]|nr:serine protease [Planctomycetaceae bacterium]
MDRNRWLNDWRAERVDGIARRNGWLTLGMLAAFSACIAPGVLSAKEAEKPPAVRNAEGRERKGPLTVAELAEIERKVTKVADEASKAVVAVRIGRAQGTGVIVTKDGYVLTAAHVIGKHGEPVRFTLHDGRVARGITLGMDKSVDAGLMKITDEGEWPFAGMAADTPPETGDWCVALGHPGGYNRERGSVVRLGRIVTVRKSALQSDCTLVGGDSGGPLFNLEGNVIGIHSRIGVSTTWNFHIPVAQFRKGWDRMVKSEEFGDAINRGTAVLGVTGDDDESTCRIARVAEGYPAHEAGMKAGDIITKFDGRPIKSFTDLTDLVRKMSPGDEAKVEVSRDGKTIEMKVVLTSRE